MVCIVGRETVGFPYDPIPQAPPIIYEEVIIKAPPKKVIKRLY
jgi:hypothetical protein